MDRISQERVRQKLLQKRLDLSARLERIETNLQRGLEADSAERAKQLEDSDVVDALGNDARLELEHIAEEFLARIANDMPELNPAQRERAATAVFMVIDEEIGGGEAAQIRKLLPENIRSLWPQPESGELS